MILLVVATMLILPSPVHGATTPSTYTKQGMPNFGQHSGSWCWVGSTSSVLWYAANKGGVSNLVPSSYDQIAPDSKDPNSPYYDLNFPDQGYPLLFEKIASSTKHLIQADPDFGKTYVYGTASDHEGVQQYDYLVGLSNYITNQGADLSVTFLSQDLTTTSGCAGAIGGVPNGVTEPAHTHIIYQIPTFQDYMNSLYSNLGMVMSIRFLPGPHGGHDVAAVGYDNTRSTPTITIADPGDPCTPVELNPITLQGGACASPNNDPTQMVYKTCNVTSINPLQGTCPQSGFSASYDFQVDALTYFSSSNTPPPSQDNQLHLSAAIDSAQSVLRSGGSLYYAALFTNGAASVQARITSINFTENTIGLWTVTGLSITIDPGKSFRETIHFTIPTNVPDGTYNGQVKAAVDFMVNGQWTPSNPPILIVPLSVEIGAPPPQGVLSFDSAVVDTGKSTLQPGGTFYYVATFTNSANDESRLTGLVVNAQSYTCPVASSYLPVTIDIGKTVPLTVSCSIPSSTSPGDYEATITATIEFYVNGQWSAAVPPTQAKYVTVTIIQHGVPVSNFSVSIDSTQSSLNPNGVLYYSMTFKNPTSSQMRITGLTLSSDFGTFSLGSSSLPIVVDPGATTTRTIHLTIPSTASIGTHQATVKATVEILVNGQWQAADPQTLEQPLAVTVSQQTGLSSGLIGGIVLALIIGGVFAAVLLVRRQRRSTSPVRPSAPEFNATGSTAIGAVFCPNCGTRNMTGSPFCSSCGSRIE